MTEINRHLTDDERTLMCPLAIETVTEQTGRDRESVADELDAMAIVVHGDATDAYLDVDGKTLAHITREDLALAANHPARRGGQASITTRRGAGHHRERRSPPRDCLSILISSSGVFGNV